MAGVSFPAYVELLGEALGELVEEKKSITLKIQRAGYREWGKFVLREGKPRVSILSKWILKKDIKAIREAVPFCEVKEKVKKFVEKEMGELGEEAKRRLISLMMPLAVQRESSRAILCEGKEELSECLKNLMYPIGDEKGREEVEWVVRISKGEGEKFYVELLETKKEVVA